MVVRKPKLPSPQPLTPSPEDSPRCSTAFSDCDADDEEAMSTEETIHSRPLSEATSHGNIHPVGPYCPRRPTLQDVLTNSAPPPWSLSAFTAYLSQNHCLETLEFTMDSERYRQKYDKMAAQTAGMPMTPDMAECEHVRMLWRRLMNAYIVPNGPREVNLPSNVRDALLSLPNHTSPPPPETLDDAVKIIYELMDESVLVPFLNEVSSSRGAASYTEVWDEADENLDLQGSLDERTLHRNRSRRRQSPPFSSLDLAMSPPGAPRSRLSHSSSLTAGITRGRLSAHASNSPTGAGDAGLTDDSGSASSPGKEPMTPPTTPPSSDIGGSSPRSRSDNTWKKMMGKLGSKKKPGHNMRKIDDEADF
ncbi:hypothetical protein MMC24_006713 [Lignoscripta atroalba]|nr:hypothetical protein [Lignoscripta atroalba]